MRENNRQTEARVCEDWRVTAVALVWRSDGNFGLASPVWRPHTLPVLLGMPAPPAYIVDGSFGAQQEGWMDRLTDNMFQLVCLETCGCPARERKTLGEKGEGNRNRISFFFFREFVASLPVSKWLACQLETNVWFSVAHLSVVDGGI